MGLLRGRYDQDDAPGQVNHFEALSTALAGTVGMGNIGGVALAIAIGGPGAVFWMWMTAVVGMATKFFTCTLAVMYRGTDDDGTPQGGPMYVIATALPRLRPLAVLFAAAGMVGSLPAFQTNQLVQILREVVAIPNGWLDPANAGVFNLAAGMTLAGIAVVVIFGGLSRIVSVASRLVPLMAVLYIGAALTAIALNVDAVPGVLWLILSDAFTGSAVGGGALGAVILYGVQRGAYSNEAGVGTEAIAHGAARTTEPVREGLVAMVGPVVDTLLVCTATAVVILLSGVWQQGDSGGVTLTAQAFETLLGTPGLIVLFVCVICFATTTLFTYSFYGSQCFRFLFGDARVNVYRWTYVGFIVVAALVSLNAAIGLIDAAFGLMVVPTMLSTLLLGRQSPRRGGRLFCAVSGKRRAADCRGRRT